MVDRLVPENRRKAWVYRLSKKGEAVLEQTREHDLVESRVGVRAAIHPDPIRNGCGSRASIPQRRSNSDGGRWNWKALGDPVQDAIRVTQGVDFSENVVD